MKLIFVYGPPAVGKLTISKQLASITKFQLFHNHSTFDMAADLFEKWSPPFLRYCHETRISGIRLAAEYDQDLIFTFAFCYCEGDIQFIKSVKEAIELYDAEINFVRLVAPMKELELRVNSLDRQKFGKVKTKDELEEFCTRYDAFRTIPGVEALELNTTKMQPSEAANCIVNHYNLPRKGES